MATVARTMTLTERQQRAIQRAEIMGGASVAAEIQPNLYCVTGRRGDIYHIRVDGTDFRCECESGLYNKPCWHAACVWLHRMAENRLGTAPAAAPVATPEPRFIERKDDDRIQRRSRLTWKEAEAKERELHAHRTPLGDEANAISAKDLLWGG